MKEQLLHIRYEEVETGEIYALDIWDRTGDDVWNLIEAYDGANGTSFFQEIERILDVTVIDTRYVVKVSNENDETEKIFHLGTGLNSVEDIIEDSDFNDDIWNVFMTEMMDSIYELYKDWRRDIEDIIWVDLEEKGWSDAIDGFDIREAEEETEEET
jgi:hypothetical protein